MSGVRIINYVESLFNVSSFLCWNLCNYVLNECFQITKFTDINSIDLHAYLSSTLNENENENFPTCRLIDYTTFSLLSAAIARFSFNNEKASFFFTGYTHILHNILA